MKIWIMRHGEAGFNSTSDSQRSLTEQGKKISFEKGLWLGNRLTQQNQQIDKILVSPYLRTQQTLTELTKGIFQISKDLQTEDIEIWQGITPAGNPQNVVSYLDILRKEGIKNLLIISHLPLVYELVSYLTLHQSQVHFYPAVIAEIDWSKNNGKLIIKE